MHEPPHVLSILLYIKTKEMKKVFLVAAILVTAFVQQSSAQESKKSASPELISSYYNLKDALVKGNSGAAALSATELSTAFSAGKEMIPELMLASLVKDADAIAKAKNIKVQREKLASLSVGMIELSKTIKLSADPVYEQYCPMQKASWLSSSKSIKNPYYGSAMLTCGSVRSTL